MKPVHAAPRRRGVVRSAIAAAGAAGLLTVGASAALATGPTITPNPVAPGGTLSITPDATCIADMAAKTGRKNWLLVEAFAGPDTPFATPQSTMVLSSDVVPGSYKLVATAADRGVPSCEGTVVVAVTTGVPFVEPRAMLTFGALGLGAGAVVLKRRRRRATLR